MSLILEALRKSEAERRRGLPPDLHAELPPPAPVPRGLPWPAVWWGLAGAVALASVAWWGVRGRAPSPSANETPQRAIAAPGAAAQRAAQPASLQPPPSPAPPPPTPTPARAASDAVPIASEATAAAPRTAAVETRASMPAAVRGPGASGQRPGATGQGPGELSAPAPQAAVPAAPAPRPGSGPPVSAATPAPAPANATTPSGAAAAPPAGARVLALAELDPGTRSALPPLKLSMHLWNADRTRRFVILDGQRLGEGDRIGEASVVSIERDGVLLDWHGRGIRVPVR